jgi:uncharacterized cupin superfamily protein
MASKGFRLLPEDDPRVDMQPSNFTAPEAFTSGDHREVNHYFHREADESAPCKEEIESYPANEMMTVISGSLTVTNEDGEAETFTSGDSLFIPKGAKVTWHITETLKKYYLIAA